MGINEKTQSRTTQERGSEKSVNRDKVERKQSARTKEVSRSSRDERIRSNRPNRRGRDPFGLVNSEVISKLLEAVKVQITQTQSLIDSQQERLQELSAYHDELLTLRKLQLQTQEDNDSNHQLTEKE